MQIVDVAHLHYNTAICYPERKVLHVGQIASCLLTCAKIVLLYRPQVLHINRRCASIDLQHVLTHDQISRKD